MNRLKSKFLSHLIINSILICSFQAKAGIFDFPTLPPIDPGSTAGTNGGSSGSAGTVDPTGSTGGTSDGNGGGSLGALVSGGSNSGTVGIGPNIDGLNQRLDLLNTNWAATNTALDQFGVDWSVTNVEFGQANSTLSDISSHAGDAVTQMEVFNGHVGDGVTQFTVLNGHAGDAVTQMGVFNGHAGDAVTQMGIFNGHMGDAVAQLTSIGGSVDLNWQSTNAQIGMINQNWAQTNQLIGHLISPLNAFITGAGAGVGIGLGSAAVSLTVQGLKTAFQAIYEAATHEKRDARILLAFQKAKEDYPKVKTAIEEMEARTDSYQYAKEGIQEAGSKRNLLAKLTLTIRREQTVVNAYGELSTKLYKTAHQLNSTGTGKRAEIDHFIREIKSLDKLGAEHEVLLREVVKFRDLLEQIREAHICTKMQEDMAHLIEAESILQQIRLTMIEPQNQTIWEDAWDKDLKEELGFSKNLQNQGRFKTLFKAQRTSAESLLIKRLRFYPDLKTKIYSAWYSCLNQNNPWTENPIMARGLSFFDTTLRRACWKLVTNPNDEEYAKEYSIPLRSIVTAIQMHVDDAKSRSEDVQSEENPRLNEELNAMARREYQRFFDQLRAEQLSLQTAIRIKELKKKKKRIEQLCSVHRAEGNLAVYGGVGPLRKEGRGANPVPTFSHPGVYARVD